MQSLKVQQDIPKSGELGKWLMIVQIPAVVANSVLKQMDTDNTWNVIADFVMQVT